MNAIYFRRYTSRFALFAVLLGVGLSSTCLGSEATRLASCRVTNALCSGVANLGSGTLIDVTDDRQSGFVLTCAHLFSEGVGQVSVEFPDGSRHGALLVGIDATADLAAREIRNPRSAPAGVSLASASSSQYSACGFGQTGNYACSPGRVLGEVAGAGQVSLRIAGGVRSGDSGGGVFDPVGRLAAVVWGTADGVTYASGGAPLRRFLQRHLGSRFSRVVRVDLQESLAGGGNNSNRRAASARGGCANGLCPTRPPRIVRPPSASRPAPRTPQSRIREPHVSEPRVTKPQCDCENLRQRLAELEKRTGDAEAQSPVVHSPAVQLPERQENLDGTLGRLVGMIAASALGLSGPAGLAVLAAGSVGGWWLASRRRQAKRARRTENTEREASVSQGTADCSLPTAESAKEANSAAEATFCEAADDTFQDEQRYEVETDAPIERDDREARQLLRLSQLEGRDPLQDALAGRLALDRLDEIAERDADAVQSQWADALRRELRERFNDVAPTKFEVPASRER